MKISQQCSGNFFLGDIIPFHRIRSMAHKAMVCEVDAGNDAVSHCEPPA